MVDEDGVRFLTRALPRLRMRWIGFRKVRRQACQRIARRMTDVGCVDIVSYRAHLARHEDERWVLDGLCRITIFRFGPDRPQEAGEPRGPDPLRELALVLEESIVLESGLDVVVPVTRHAGLSVPEAHREAGWDSPSIDGSGSS